MRALIVHEDSHRSYGEAMVGAVRASRPGLEVALAHLRTLKAELERFDPHLMVSSRPNTFEAGRRAAWVLLSDVPTEPSGVCMTGGTGSWRTPG